MGWGSLLGDLAKGFASGYIEERGIKGTLEDLGSVASSAKNFFSSNNQSNDNLEEVFWGIYNQYMEDSEYQSAIEFVEDFYTENALEEDYSYFFLLANAQGEMKYDNDMLIQAINNYSRAYRMCPKGTEDAKTIKDNLDELKEYRRIMDAWDAVGTEIDEYLKENKFQKAIQSLKGYYREYENNQFDYWYWKRLYDIYEQEAFGFVDRADIADAIFEARIKDMQNVVVHMRELADEEQISLCDTNDSSIAFLQQCRVYAKTMDRIEQHLARYEFKEALEVLETFNSTDTDAYGYDYWMKLFRINRLKAEYACERGENFSEEIQILESSLKRAKELAQRDGDEDQLNNAKAASKKLEDLKMALKQQPKKGTTVDSSSNSAEAEYAEEIMACLADDGLISDRERRILERLRKTLGISEERAKEIEIQCKSPDLSESEVEYAEEIKACLADDGLISDRERRILERLRKSLNISSERAKEIESIYSK